MTTLEVLVVLTVAVLAVAVTAYGALQLLFGALQRRREREQEAYLASVRREMAAIARQERLR